MAVINAQHATGTIRRIAFDGLPGFSSLFRAYVAGEPAALAFFARDWRDRDHRAEAARDAAAAQQGRDEVALVLAQQNEGWGNDGLAARASLMALADPVSVAVVTGQQIGLFGGPLYGIYKAATAVRLARSEAERLGRPVVPVFWMADEDHDFEEVRAAAFLASDGVERVELPADGARPPVGRRVLGEAATIAVNQVVATLPVTEHTASLVDLLRDTYHPGATMRDAFARFVSRLFRGTGLVLVSADDPRLKRLVEPVMRRELERPDESLAALVDASTRLESQDYGVQVTPLPGNVFILEPEGRFTLDPEDGSFVARGLGRRYERASLLERLAERPEDFSPNVALRPLCQDTLLPTMAYVAGPGEINYFAQLRGLYETFGVPMPAIYPRASVTTLDSRVRRIMERHTLDLEDLGDGGKEIVEAIHKRLALNEYGELDDVFSAARDEVRRVLGMTQPAIREVDPALERSVASTAERMVAQIDALERKVVRAVKRQHADLHQDVEAVVEHLHPGGTMQERSITGLHLLNAHGFGLIEALVEWLDVDTSEHFVVTL